MTAPSSHKIIAWSFFFAIIGGYLLMAGLFPQAYIVATYEDLIGEWAQVFLFAATLVLSVRVTSYRSAYRFFFAVLAIACFYVVGEEISWGQRIFNIATPEFFTTHNLQDETNLHNFFTGPIKTTTKMVLEYLIALGLVGYGLVFPLLVKLRWRLALWLTAKGLPHPPLYLWPFFTTSAILELGFLSFNEAELAEILIPLALALMTANYLLALQRQPEITTIPDWDKAAANRLMRQTCTLVIGVLLLACFTTAASYTSPRLKGLMENRFLSGVEKFAERYQRLGEWQTAAELLEKLHAHKPQQAEILRQLFRCYSELRQSNLAGNYLQQAIQVDNDYLAQKPLSVATHLSLAKTYHLAGDEANGRAYLEGAMEVARHLNQREPRNAGNRYWLGRAYEGFGELEKALEEYRQALSLSPGTLKFQKAVGNLSRQIEARAGAE